MGIDVYLEDETGEKLESIYDPTSILPRLIPSHADKSSQCLRFIDPYGVTVYNGLQMPFLLEELETLLQRTQGQEAKEFVARIIELAQRTQNDVHLYLKFNGD